MDPATGEIWRHWPAISDEQVVAAAARARTAQPEWTARSLGDRRRILPRFRYLLLERRAEIASLIEREAGKPAVEAMAADVITTLDVARFLERHSPRVRQPWWFGYGAEHAPNIDSFARFWLGDRCASASAMCGGRSGCFGVVSARFEIAAPGSLEPQMTAENRRKLLAWLPELHATDLHR